MVRLVHMDVSKQAPWRVGRSLWCLIIFLHVFDEVETLSRCASLCGKSDSATGRQGGVSGESSEQPFCSPDALCPSIRSRSLAALGILPRDILQLRRATAAAYGRSGHRLWISGANAAELVLFGVHGFPAGPISPGSGPAAQHGDRGRRALVGSCSKFLGAAAARMYQSATCMCLEGRLAGL